MNTQPETVIFGAVTAPIANQTITLFDSTVALGGPGRMRMMNLTMLEVNFIRLGVNGSAASGLVPKESPDGGTNWYGMDFKDSAGTGTMPVTVAALAANANKLHTFVINNIRDFQLLYTQSGTAPTTWTVEITGIFGGASVQK